MVHKKNVRNRRQGALERLRKVQEPNERQQKEIAVLEKRLNS
jgi:hypothetical protein